GPGLRVEADDRWLVQPRSPLLLAPDRDQMALGAEVHDTACDRGRRVRGLAQRVRRQELEVVRGFDHDHIAGGADRVELTVHADRRAEELAGHALLPHLLAGARAQTEDDAAVTPEKEEVAH